MSAQRSLHDAIDLADRAGVLSPSRYRSMHSEVRSAVAWDEMGAVALLIRCELADCYAMVGVR